MARNQKAERSDGEWSRKELRVLRRFGARRSLTALAARLGREEAAVRTQLQQLGIVSTTELAKRQTGKGIPGTAGERGALFLLMILFVGMAFLFYPWSADSFQLPKTLFYRVAIATFLFFAAIRSQQTHRLMGPAPREWLPLLFFPFLLLPATLTSSTPLLSWRAWCFFLSGASVFLIARVGLSHPRRRQILWQTLLFVFLAQGGYALLQFLGVDPIFHPPEIQRLKVFGFTGNPNFLAGFLAAGFPLILSLLLERGWIRIVAGGTAIVCVLAVWVAGSKGGLLSLTLGGAFFLVWVYQTRSQRRSLGRNTEAPPGKAPPVDPRRYRVAVGGTLVVVILVAAVLHFGTFSVWNSMKSSLNTRGRSIGIRLVYWGSTLKMIKARPLLGWGPGCFRARYLDFQGDFLAEPGHESFIPAAGNPLYAHNDYLQLTAESGLIGLLGLVVLLVLIGRAGWRQFRCGDELQARFAAAAGAGLLAILAQSLVSFPQYRPLGSLEFWVFAAVWSGGATPAVGRWTIPQRYAWLLPVLATGILLAAGWTGWRRLQADIAFKNGQLLASRGKWAAAQRAFIRGKEWDPAHGKIWMNLGLVQFNQGQYAAAVKSLEKSEHFARNPMVHLTLADALDRLHRFPDAVREYKRAMRLSPGNPMVKNNYAACLYAAGKKKEAVAQWQLALKRRPDYIDALANLSVALYALHDDAAAGRLAQRVLIHPQASPKQRRQAQAILSGAARRKKGTSRKLRGS